MSAIDQQFKELCQRILDAGIEYENKNRGVTRLQIPSYTFRHEFFDGFPAISIKPLPIKTVITELLWFLCGDNDVTYLNNNGVKIWNKDAYNWYCKEYEQIKRGYDAYDKEPPTKLSFEEFSAKGTGSVGQNYSVQWRNFNGKTDQIADLIAGMRKDIMSSRLKVNAWNPTEIFETALPPCHSEFQIIGVPLDGGKFGFELHWNQRSVDVFLGLPFNIASYGALAKILEQITGFEALAIEGTLKCVHFYDNQYQAVETLMDRDEHDFPNCELVLSCPYPSEEIDSTETLNKYLSGFSVSQFKLSNYQSGPPIKVEMLAPTKL